MLTLIYSLKVKPLARPPVYKSHCLDGSPDSPACWGSRMRGLPRRHIGNGWNQGRRASWEPLPKIFPLRRCRKINGLSLNNGAILWTASTSKKGFIKLSLFYPVWQR